MSSVKVGRPSKLTPSVADTICAAIEVGANYEDAARYAGISSSTLSNWRVSGEDIDARVQASEEPLELTPDEARLWDFWKRFKEAEAAGAVNCATIVYNAAMRDPVWAEKWLERRRPEEWRLSQRTELTGKDGGPVEHTVTARLEDAISKVYGNEVE